MKKSCLFLPMLLAVAPVLAQISDLDELPLPQIKQKLAASKDDTNRVRLQLALGHAILFQPGGGKKEIDLALTFASQAAELSRQLGYNLGKINAMLLSAESYYRKPDPEKGFKIAHQALDYANKVNNQDGMARAYIVMGQFYKFADPLARIGYNNKAITIFQKERNLRWLAITQTVNAELLYLTGKPTDAIKLLFETLNIGEAVNRKTIERIYWHIGRTSAELGDLPSSLKYNLLAIRTAKELRDSTLVLCSIYHTTALTYVKMKDYSRAAPYSLMALNIARHYHANDYINTVAVL